MITKKMMKQAYISKYNVANKLSIVRTIT